MSDRELAERLLRDHLLAAAALTAVQLRQLPEDARLRVIAAVKLGTGYVQLRTCVDKGTAEVVLVPADGSEVMWLTRMKASERAE